jgi:uncharacterized membrane protein YbhN (UPF0104 family)
LAPPTDSKRSGARWTGILGVGISLVLLWWALHDVSLAEVWLRLKSARFTPLLVTIALATARFPLVTVRWRYLLRLEGSALPFMPLWHATAIGFMANNLLPARAGELARAYAAGRLTDVRFTTAFASIAVERMMDGIVLVGFLVIGIWAGGFAADTSLGGVTLGTITRGAGIVFGGAFIAAVVLVRWPGPFVKLSRSLARRVLPERWAARLVGILEGLLLGLEGLRSPGRFVAVLFWSVVVWLVTAASFWTGYLAFEIAAPWSAALLQQGLVSFGVAVPSSPGFVGVFEAVIRVSLALYGIEEGRAVSYAIGYHSTTFLPITLLGMWSLSRARLHLGELRGVGVEGAGGAAELRQGGRAAERQ